MNVENVTTWATVSGVVISIAALIIETRRSRAAHQVDLILNFENRFLAEDMQKKRRMASEFLKNYRSLDPGDARWGKVSDVVDFFQTLGTFAKSGHVNIELIYKFFYYWLSHYWSACQAYIEKTRSQSSITWEDAAWLHARLRAYDRRHNAGALSNINSAQLDSFFEWELENLASQ